MRRTSPADVDATSSRLHLTQDFSIEITGKDVETLEVATEGLRPGTQISITALPNEDSSARIRAAVKVRELGFEPVPHIAANRVASAADLESFLDEMTDRAAVSRAFVIAGDAVGSLGPYANSLELIQSGLFEKYGLQHIGIGGHPDGHPAVDEATLWKALSDKHDFIRRAGLGCFVMTQFGFDAEATQRWVHELRARGIDAPARIGVAGPTNVKNLIRFAARCGVAASTNVLSKYGISLAKLFGTAGPDRLVNDLAAGLMPSDGDVALHFFPFGGVGKTVDWVRDYRANNAAAVADHASVDHTVANRIGHPA